MDFSQLQKTRCGSLIDSLELIINKIKTEKNKNPIVMMLLGCYPNYTLHNRTPHHTPKYLEHVLTNYPDVFPIVLAIDPQYTPENIRKDNTLQFLKYNQENLIKLVDSRDRFNTSSNTNVSDKYILTQNKNLTYRFLGWTLDENEIEHILWYLNLKTISGIPTLFWNFTGNPLGDIKIMREGFLHHPEPNCMGDVGFDLEYFPILIKNNDNGYKIIDNPKSLSDLYETYQLTMTQYITLDLDETDEKKNLKTQIEFYESNLYYILNEILSKFRGYYSWANQFKTEGFIVDKYDNNYNDKIKTIMTRLNGFEYRTKFICDFEKSKYRILDDFVRGEIFNIGSNCINFLSILDPKLDYTNSLANLIDGKANIFDDFIIPILTILKKKYPELI